MLTGFNTNVTYKGEVFHVQTEDSGLRNPVITTLLYKGGWILASKKTSYKELLSEGIQPPKEKIRQLMAEQHKAMIAELFSGKFDDLITKPGESLQKELRRQEEKSLTVTGSADTIDKGNATTFSGEVTDSPEKQGPSITSPSGKESAFRSLDDVLLEHILKRKKGLTKQ